MYRHILFPHDGTRLTKEAENECITLAKAMGARITVIRIARSRNVIPEEWGPDPISSWVQTQIEAGSMEAIRDGLAELRRKAEAQGVECDTVVRAGSDPSKHIIDQAKAAGCDLIVMASYGSTAFESLVRGSQTINVLHNCELPVLVIRPLRKGRSPAHRWAAAAR